MNLIRTRDSELEPKNEKIIISGVADVSAVAVALPKQYRKLNAADRKFVRVYSLSLNGRRLPLATPKLLWTKRFSLSGDATV